MNIPKMMQDLVQYLAEGFARIFGPNDDEYPEIGTQPFEGDPYQAKEAD
ncbi:hypothetical protein PCC7424_5126 [Gloeothece citriformis PCC 7424]|uniref:Isochorismate synthase n=1 Tax=Gloeothece citriformis (strain PCC 7424) TaxID=65393 RepID=B7KGZ0_GLOC7|nr:hypothetical protein [Gloeothece citriformis]ACK73477.1 hypothetical protein PCC7424_5126 [Gloeothece citriformis PCC 7424]